MFDILTNTQLRKLIELAETELRVRHAQHESVVAAVRKAATPAVDIERAEACGALDARLRRVRLALGMTTPEFYDLFRRELAEHTPVPARRTARSLSALTEWAAETLTPAAIQAVVRQIEARAGPLPRR